MYSDKIEVRQTKNGKSVFAKSEFIENELIFKFEKNYIGQPTRTSLQVDKGVHQESTNHELLENFLSHACNPNCYIDFRNLTLRALRSIKKGEELTFNYLTTEWDLANKFICHCGAKNCYKQINGFKYLTYRQREKLKPFLSPFLKNTLNTR